jgi:hypothetical protein
MPDVAYYAFSEPWLSAPNPDEWSVWRDMSHLRKENHAWRQCVAGLVEDLRQRPMSAEGYRAVLNKRVKALGEQLSSSGPVATPEPALGARQSS